MTLGHTPKNLTEYMLSPQMIHNSPRANTYGMIPYSRHKGYKVNGVYIHQALHTTGSERLNVGTRSLTRLFPAFAWCHHSVSARFRH